MHQRLWFKAKEYGYGWYPCTWEGWLVLVVFIFAAFTPPVIVIQLGLRIPDAQFAAFFIPYIAILVSVFIWVCIKKGRRHGGDGGW
jgi:hypothetical protein